LECLWEKPGRGRKTSLTKVQLTKIEKVLKEKSEKVGIKAPQWTGALLADYITNELSVSLQTRHCQRLLQRFGYSNLRGRPMGAPV